MQLIQRRSCSTMCQSLWTLSRTTPLNFLCHSGNIYANINSNNNFHPSEDIEELERCREQPTLLATPTSCPLIFDSVLCFNSTLGVISYTLVENFSLITRSICQYFDILPIQEENEHLRPVQGLRLVKHM